MSEEILKRYKIRAKKALWQNFLIKQEIIKKIAKVIEIENKNIIEVWPWYWALTEQLLKHNFKSLTLIELDSDMIKILEDRISRWELNTNNTEFTIKNIDILKYKSDYIEYSVIANIPYYITSPILRHFLYDLENKPDEMVILMQKDVWDKILDIFKDKKSKSSVIWLMMAKKTNVTEEILVTPDNFIPAPNVQSCVLKFVKHNNFDKTDDEIFLRFVKIWFSSARKKLIKNFTNAWLDKNKILDIFKKLEINENIRWEALWIKKWCELSEELNKI